MLTQHSILQQMCLKFIRNSITCEIVSIIILFCLHLQILLGEKAADSDSDLSDVRTLFYFIIDLNSDHCTCVILMWLHVDFCANRAIPVCFLLTANCVQDILYMCIDIV